MHINDKQITDSLNNSRLIKHIPDADAPGGTHERAVIRAMNQTVQNNKLIQTNKQTVIGTMHSKHTIMKTIITMISTQ